MTESLILPAPAKLNLFLHVLGRREDGYHELQTLFTFIDLQDEIELEAAAPGEFIQGTPIPGVAPETDLSLRAARALNRAAGGGFGAKISVKKRIPMGGGLGGGSSNAASVLLGLNELWGLNMSREALKSIGLQLGADVPVFIQGDSAWAEGIGEKLTRFEVPMAWYVVLTPDVSVPTALVFSAPELTRNTPRTTMMGFSVGEGRNDLEPVVFSRFPQVKEALSWLSQFGVARMSGSGSSVFVAFSEESAAIECFRKKPLGWSGWITRGLQDHPLKNWP